MGSSQVSDYFPEKKDYEEVSYGEIARSLCPDYLAMGMTLTEYWDGDPDDYKSVREAHRLDLKQRNHDAWLHGFYVYNALQCVSPMFRDLIRDHHAEKYFEEPLDFYPDKKKQDEQRREDDRELANQAKVKAWVDRVNRLKAQNQKKEGTANG